MLGAAPLAHAADAVPIFEREMPTDPAELKEYMEELDRALKGIETATKQEKAKNIAATLAEPAKKARPVEIEIPKRDEDQIKIASRRVLTAQTIAAEFAGLIQQLRAGLDRESVTEAERFLKAYGTRPNALANAAAIGWVQEAPGTALLLAAEAARRAPDNANVLNTLGSLLADAGYAARGIPILDYLARKYPEDPTLQNNLGQAWLGLGAPELAKPRLQACLSRAPAHGAAHAAMGVIAYSNGDHAGATKHFQAAVASQSSPLSRRALDRLGAGYTLPRSFRRLAPVQEFFNPRHFVPPVAQEALSQAANKRAEIAAFSAMVTDRMNRAETAMNAANAKVEQTIGLKANLASSLPISPVAALHGLDFKNISGAFAGAARRGAEFARDVEKFTEESSAIWERAQEKVAGIREAFRKEWTGAEVGEGRARNQEFIFASEKLCTDCRQVMDSALPAIAQRYNDLVVQVSTRERVATNEELTYLPLIAGGELYRQEFYSRVIVYLHRMGMLAAANPVREYNCGPPPLTGGVGPAVGDLPSPGSCPIKLKINLTAARFNADCTSIGFEIDAGLKFTAKKNFQSGETTLKGGVGADLELGPVGQVEGSGQFVVVWDRGNSLSFIGVESSASAGISGIPGLDGTLDAGAGTSVTGTLPTNTADLVNVSSETKLGITLGPRGVEPTLQGSTGAEVLGRDLVKATL